MKSIFPTTQKDLEHKIILSFFLFFCVYRLWREDRKHNGSIYTVSFSFAISIFLLFLSPFLHFNHLFVSSYDSAVAVGTEMLEMDVHLTLDGCVVVSHDNNLLRETGYDKTISSLRFEVVILTINFSLFICYHL